MRILIANDQHWPMKSGVATAVRTQAQGLAALGHEVLVVAPSQNRKNAVDHDENYDIVRIRSFKFRNNLRVSVVLDREARRILREFNPDIVHVHTQLTVGLAVLRAATHLKIPVVATNHVMPENIVENVKLLSPLSKSFSYIWTEYGNLLYRGAKRIIMPTASALALFNLDRIEAPTLAMSNGINLDRFSPGKASAELYKKFAIPQDKKIIGYLGRLDNEKHIDVAMGAFAKLLSQDYDLHMILVGTGNAEANLKRLATSLSIEDRVTFTGLVSDEDMVELHKVTTIYCMPSPAELQSISLLEAMASGKPAVSVDAGALSELCRNDENGYLVYVDDVNGFMRGLQMLLDNPRRISQFGKRSREIAEIHDEKIVIPKFINVYNEVISESRA
jgi:1,2-diacylglycerol 3-alpha-glucosyltransferase